MVFVYHHQRRLVQPIAIITVKLLRKRGFYMLGQSRLRTHPDVIASHHNAAFFDNSARGTSCLLAVNKLFLAISVVTLLVSSVSALGDETRAETSLQSGVS